MTDRPKIVNIGGKPSELVVAVDQMLRDRQAYLDYAKLTAEIRRAGYDAYLANGFDEAQALELCKFFALN